MRISRSITLSAIMHATALIVAFMHNGGTGNNSISKEDKGENQGSRYKGIEAAKVIEQEKPVEVSIVYADPNPAILIHNKKTKKSLEIKCPKHWYGGLGIILTFSSAKGEHIETLYKGYGADLSGLKEGDVIEGTEGAEILGAPGTTLRMHILRGTQHLVIEATRTKVCY